MKNHHGKSLKKRSKKPNQNSNCLKREAIQLLCTIFVLTTIQHRRRIPETQEEFNSYIRSVQNYLNTVRTGEPQKRGLMIGLTAGQINSLVNTWYKKWVSGNPAAPGLWEIHENTYGATKNPVNNKDVKKFMKEFNVFFKPLLNIMAANPSLDATDRTILHIKQRDPVNTFHPVPDDRGPSGAVRKVISLTHLLAILDPGSPDTKEQPQGVVATRIYRAIKDQHVQPHPTDYLLVGDTSTWEYASTFKPEHVGKRAHYYTVWIDSKRKEGTKGNNFSETII